MAHSPRNGGEQKVPGLRGVEHIGITVPDIDEATRFFVNVLGCTPYLDSGPLGSDDDDRMTRLLNVHPRAVARKMRHLRCGHGSNIELFEYSAPDQNTTWPKNSDLGGHHLAFYSDDFDATLDWLRAHGVRLLEGPNFVTKGQNSGCRWIYFLSPWGLQMELVSFPEGRGYEATAKGRLWNPVAPEA
ncbi:glyoxalase [Zhengella mangrovi]|uniref:Glyoxalase n=1 Tax=Zhengella mangrovi TaxID=1982044 RepID=A0A2G1QMN1_9HYPH|nr:VOC family protein [Zhengella mangrovi]PHP66773.1 glyoxalase [Zhengella mangrovi]